jgi:hypothetical protein
MDFCKSLLLLASSLHLSNEFTILLWPRRIFALYYFLGGLICGSLELFEEGFFKM